MTGLDTNLLLGWILEDHARPLPGKPPYRISLTVLVELIWVLSHTFKRPRDEQADVIDALLATPDLVLGERKTIAAALKDFLTGPADFADYLIAHENRAAGCRTTWTLDRKAARHSGFTLAEGAQ